MMEDRRRYPRYEIVIEARISSADLNLIVSVVDISEGGLGIISEKRIETGVKISISLFPIIEEPIVGTPVWSSYIERDKKYYYRIGIETENLALEELKVFGFPISSEFKSKIGDHCSKK